MTKRIQRGTTKQSGIPMQDFGMEIDVVRGQLDSASLREELELCRALINKDIEDNFWNSQTPDGDPWPPRKPNPHDDGHPLLILSMTLFMAAVGQGPGAIQAVEDRRLVMSIDLGIVPYARAQDRGYPPNNLPARNYFGARQATLERCRRIIMKGMKKKAWPSAYD